MVVRVLLTGASGFVGSHVLNQLLMHDDYEIFCPVTFRHLGSSARLSQVIDSHAHAHRRVYTFMHDLTGPIDPVTARKLGDIDCILNVASDSHVDRSIESPVPFVQNNVNLMLNLMEYARTLPNLKMFLHMSTDEVYGPMPFNRLSCEWDTILPSNPYSASKAAQEAIGISYWRTYGIPLVITNTMNLFGPMQDSEKYFAKIMRCLMRDESITVHVDGRTGAYGSRYYIHAGTFADAWYHLLETHEPATYPNAVMPSRFNIVGDREVNNFELVQMIASVMEKKPHITEVDFHSSRPGHDLKYGLDNKRMTSTGWKPRYSFESNVSSTVTWTMRHPEWL